MGRRREEVVETAQGVGGAPVEHRFKSVELHRDPPPPPHLHCVVRQLAHSRRRHITPPPESVHGSPAAAGGAGERGKLDRRRGSPAGEGAAAAPIHHGVVHGRLGGCASARCEGHASDPGCRGARRGELVGRHVKGRKHGEAPRPLPQPLNLREHRSHVLVHSHRVKREAHLGRCAILAQQGRRGELLLLLHEARIRGVARRLGLLSVRHRGLDSRANRCRTTRSRRRSPLCSRFLCS